MSSSLLVPFAMIYYLSMFINIVVSVVLEVGSGCDSFPTANKFWASSYKPTVVTYGSK